MLHARCVVEVLARGAVPAPLRFPEANFEAWYTGIGTHWKQRFKRTWAFAVGKMRGGLIDDVDLSSRGLLWNGWGDNSLVSSHHSTHFAE